MEDQTNNKIREEFLEWCKEDPALELANGVGSFENIADWFLPKIDELLKSQREELVKKIEKISDFADSGDTLKSRIINLIKNN